MQKTWLVMVVMNPTEHDFESMEELFIFAATKEGAELKAMEYFIEPGWYLYDSIEIENAA